MQNSTKSSFLNQFTSSAKSWLAAWLPKNWHSFNGWHLLLMPFSWLFYVVTSFRKYLYQKGIFKSYALAVPVIVVGNINVGGTGKTPLVIYLVEQLRILGLNPGVISRGYGGHSNQVQAVSESDDPAVVGDEPLLIKRRLACPVYVSVNRVLAGQKLLEENLACDIIISDDGLQHYRLKRNFEVVVVDGNTGFGNGALLPAGPLREPLDRLKTVDAIVTNGMYMGAYYFSRWYGNKTFEMQLQAETFYNLQHPDQYCEAKDLSGKKLAAVAGIGNPQRFFQQLENLGLKCKQHSFPDHHAFVESDFAKMRKDVILMTEKDAVKCMKFEKDNLWVLPVSVILDEDFLVLLLNKLESSED